MPGMKELIGRFRATGPAPAVVGSDGTVTTYGALAARIETLVDRFAAAGIGPGTSVQLIGDFGAEDIAWLVALWARGAIVGPVAPTSLEMAESFAAVSDAAFVARPDPAQVPEIGNIEELEHPRRDGRDGAGNLQRTLERALDSALFDDETRGRLQAASEKRRRWLVESGTAGAQHAALLRGGTDA